MIHQLHRAVQQSASVRGMRASAAVRAFAAKATDSLAAGFGDEAPPHPVDYDRVVHLRRHYMSPSLLTFEAYDKPLVLTRGRMQYMWDSSGKKYIDLLGQNLCISVGHCHPRVINAAIEQMKELAHCTTMYYHEQSAELSRELVEKLPKRPDGEDWVVHLVNSGSDAVDLAIQMAKVYTGRNELVSLHKAYHGLQGYAAGVTAIGKSTQPAYANMFNGIAYLPANDVKAYENYITFATGGRIGGFIAESLQGYGGIFPLQDGYLRSAFELTNKHGGVTIADEVQTGFNRCGETFWGFQMKHNNVMPDMVTMAKGMGNGVGIIGAVACRRSIADAFAHKMWFNTYGANPVASAAARAVIKVMDDEKLLENCAARGKQFTKRLSKLCGEIPQALKEIRGSGLFQGLEIAGKTPDDSTRNAREMHARLREYGVVVGRGSAAGNVFRLQPPLCIQAHDVDFVIDSIEDVARKYIKEKGL